MSRNKDLVGKNIGALMIIEEKTENNRTYYYCHCDYCGNEKWIRRDSLINGQKSCGCLSKKTQFKLKDLTNHRFGKLVAVRPTAQREPYSNSVVWECICDCGKSVLVPLSILRSGRKRSCGCLKKNNITKASQVNLSKNIVSNTNLKAISRKKPISSNKSGVTGVCWNNQKNKWLAQIQFQKKNYNLGLHSNIEDAIVARKKAEEELFGEFLKEHERGTTTIEKDQTNE